MNVYINVLSLKKEIDKTIQALAAMQKQLETISDQTPLTIKSKKNSVTDQTIDGVSIANELKNYARQLYNQHRNHRIINLFDSFAEYMQSELNINIYNKISKQRVSRLFLAIETETQPFIIKKGKTAQHRYYDIIPKQRTHQTPPNTTT